MANDCPHLLPVEKPGFHPGGTAFRVETFTPADRCALKPTSHARARNIDIGRWVMSGGSPISVCHPCSGNCPLKVPADDALMNDAKRGPCPTCQTINRRDGYGAVSCKACGTDFDLVEPAHQAQGQGGE